MDPMIISFYTNDWCYPEHAARLRSECNSLSIEFYVKEMESTRDYIKNTAIKPFFIRDTLTKFRRPVVWIDVDAIILKPLDLDITGHDIGACRHMDSRLKRQWAVATLCFNYTESALNFLDTWCEQARSGTDENAFELSWQQLKDSVKIQELPPTYHFVKWSDRLVIPENTIVCHQLSKFEDKMRRKQNGQVDEGMQ